MCLGTKLFSGRVNLFELVSPSTIKLHDVLRGGQRKGGKLKERGQKGSGKFKAREGQATGHAENNRKNAFNINSSHEDTTLLTRYERHQLLQKCVTCMCVV